MSLRRASISAALQAHRASVLANGRRCFYVFPQDVGPHSRLGKVRQHSVSDCVAAAHSWLQSVSSAPHWWFTIVERSELPGMSVTASVRDILVYADLLPVRAAPSASEVKGANIRRAAIACEPGASGASPETGTFFASTGFGEPCRRRRVPQTGKGRPHGV